MAMIEVDRLVFAERLRELYREGFDPSWLKRLQRYRSRKENGGGS